LDEIYTTDAECVSMTNEGLNLKTEVKCNTAAVCIEKPEVLICVRRIKVLRRNTDRKTANINVKSYQFTTLFKDDDGTVAQLKLQTRPTMILLHSTLTFWRSAARVVGRAFQFGQKKFRFDSIRQSDKFAACTQIVSWE